MLTAERDQFKAFVPLCPRSFAEGWRGRGAEGRVCTEDRRMKM